MLIWLTGALGAKATEKIVIPISTNETDLVLQVGDNGRLYQTYLGHRLSNRSDLKQFNWYNKAASDGSVSQRGWEAYACQGARTFLNRRWHSSTPMATEQPICTISAMR